MSAADITKAMLADFDSMKGGSVLDTTQADSLDNEISERNLFGKGHNFRLYWTPPKPTPSTMRYQSAIFSEKGTIFDWCVTQSIVPELLPSLNNMAKPCVSQCAQNRSKVKVLRRKDFGVEESFRKYYAHLSLTKIECSSTRSK